MYDFVTFYGAPQNNWVQDDNLYSSYENVIEAAIHSVPTREENFLSKARPAFFLIRRRELDFEAGSDYLWLNPHFEICKFSTDTLIPDEDRENLQLLENFALPFAYF